MSGHTPGPWRYQDDGYVFGGDGGIVCDLIGNEVGDNGEDRMDATGELIAAAPDLLEAAKRTQAYLWQAGIKAEVGSYNPLEDLAASLDVLIAKAEGKS
jgi:hypothetical protein